MVSVFLNFQEGISSVPPPRWGEVVEFDMNGGLSMIAVGAEKEYGNAFSED